MRTKNTGIAATLASVTDRDDSAEASVPPPQYSEVWSDPPQRTARPEIASASVESLQGKAPEEQELLANNQRSERDGPQRAPEIQSKLPTEPEAVYLTQPPDETKCCCCCGYPGARKYWSGCFRKSLRRQSSHEDGALMIKEAVLSICGITRMHTDGVVFRRKSAKPTTAGEEV